MPRLLPVLILIAAVVAACAPPGAVTNPGSAPPASTPTQQPVSAPPASTPARHPVPNEEATVEVRLEETDGVLTEGFTLMIRFLGPTGDEIASYDWNEDVVQQTAADDIRAFYDSVLRHSVCPSPVTVETVIHPGMEGRQPPCRTELDLQPGETATVTVFFHDRDGQCAETTSPST